MNESSPHVRRAEALIAKGDAVLQLHRPNPPNVIGFPTIPSGAFSEWRTQALAFIRAVVGPDHTYAADFAKEVNKPYYGEVSAGRGILQALRDDLAAGHVTTDTPVDAVDTIRRIGRRFHVVASQLRARHDQRSTLDVVDEYDVQDLLHALPRIFFEDVREEEWTPSYAGKSSRMDLLLKNERIVVEAKKTRIGLGARELGTQLIDDIARYQSHPDCEMLFCFVYDPDARIANPRGIERDLRRADGNFKVEVMIVPSGY